MRQTGFRMGNESTEAQQRAPGTARQEQRASNSAPGTARQQQRARNSAPGTARQEQRARNSAREGSRQEAPIFARHFSRVVSGASFLARRFRRVVFSRVVSGASFPARGRARSTQRLHGAA